MFPCERRSGCQVDRQAGNHGNAPAAAIPRTATAGLTSIHRPSRLQTNQLAASTSASCKPTDGWIERRRRDGGHGTPAALGPARTITCGEGQPAQREGHQPVQDHRLEEVVGADIAGLGRQEQPHRDQPDLRTRLGPDCPRQAIDTQARRAESQNENEKQPRRQPERPRHQVEDQKRTAMRIECVECPHERVVGKNRRILLVQEQRQPISLVAVEAVVAAQGQVKTQDDDKTSHRGRSRPARGSDRASPDIDGLLPSEPRGVARHDEFPTRPPSVPLLATSVNVSSRCPATTECT